MNKQEYIEEAKLKFEKLLTEQLNRAEQMKKAVMPKDFSKLETIRIGLCPGDGIGPIIFKEAKRILEAALNEKIASGRVKLIDIEGLTIERRLQLNEAVPSDVLSKIKACDVLLKGPTETPKGGSMESANVTLRRELDLYANVRPVKVPSANIDWMFFRENTEGEYVLGSKGIDIPGELAMDFKVTTDLGTERIARAAFNYAKANGKNNVSIVTKANIMKKTDGKFSEICHKVAEKYEGISVEDWYIDIMTANLVNSDIRSKFQVFVLPNLYGDIITDEAAEIQGGVGTAGSANIGDQYAVFEAIHGSAPRMIAEGLGAYANPSSIIKAGVMMLNHIGFSAEANRIDNALNRVLDENNVVVNGTRDKATAKEFADEILRVM